jgi:hypothetical protein
MAPARLVEEIPWSSPAFVPEPYEGPPRNVKTIDEIKFNDAVKYPKYEILGTDPKSKVYFEDVSILDCTGREPWRGDVYIEGTHEVALASPSRFPRWSTMSLTVPFR